MTLVWGWIEREHGIAMRHEQHFTVIRSSSVTPARDYDSYQSLDTRQFFLSRLAVLSRNKLRRQNYLVTSPEMNTSRNKWPKLPSRSLTGSNCSLMHLHTKLFAEMLRKWLKFFWPKGSYFFLYSWRTGGGGWARYSSPDSLPTCRSSWDVKLACSIF